MTFQEKYAKQREEAQKTLRTKLSTANIEAYADVVFKAICDKLDKEVSTEYDVEKIKTSWRFSLKDAFAVIVEFNGECIMVDGEAIKEHCIPILFFKDKIAEVLSKKLSDVGIDFKADPYHPYAFSAYLNFNSNDNSDS